jgi:hypothetical protein
VTKRAEGAPWRATQAFCGNFPKTSAPERSHGASFSFRHLFYEQTLRQMDASFNLGMARLHQYEADFFAKDVHTAPVRDARVFWRNRGPRIAANHGLLNEDLA